MLPKFSEANRPILVYARHVSLSLRRRLRAVPAALIASALLTCLPDVDRAALLYTCHDGVPNGVIDFSANGSALEECDDGNSQDGDGCDSGCHIECAAGSNCAGKTYKCKNGFANGVIEEGEQCDDGNGTNGDGCDIGCKMECTAPWVLNPETNHCYLVLQDTESATAASALCTAQLGGARLVTIRSDSEKQFLQENVLKGRKGPFRTAYIMNIGFEILADSTNVMQLLQAVPEGANPWREPGIFAGAVDVTGDYQCTGCYYSQLAPPQPSGAPWWIENGRLVFDPNQGALLPQEPDSTEKRDAICERKPVFAAPISEQGQPLIYKYGATQILYVSKPVIYKEAEAECQKQFNGDSRARVINLSAHDGSEKAEQKREAMMQYVGLLGPGVYFSQSLEDPRGAWVGLRLIDDDTAEWTDGTQEPFTSVKWGIAPLEPPSSSNKKCAIISTTTTTFLLGQIAPVQCDVARPILCELVDE